MITDERLIHNYRLGSMSAFEELFRRHRAGSLHLIHKYFEPGPTAERVLQQVFKRFHEHRHRLEERQPVLHYVFVITRNEIAQELKRTGQFKTEQWLIEEPSAETKLPEQETFQSQLHSKIQSLSENDLQHLHTKFSDGLALEEIAGAIGWPFYNSHWQEDWREFCAHTRRDEVSLFGSLRLRIQSDLYKLTPRVFFRFFVFYMVGGVLAWSVCPQMDSSLFSFSGLGWLFSKLGPSMNTFLSAAFFETVALWSVGLFLTAEQEIIIATRRASLICMLIVLAFLIILTFSPITGWTTPTLWILGALFAAIAQASLLFPISQS